MPDCTYGVIDGFFSSSFAVSSLVSAASLDSFSGRSSFSLTEFSQLGTFSFEIG